MTLAKAKARANKTYKIKASLRIVTYDGQNISIAQATGLFVSVLTKPLARFLPSF
jgi:hypothetical protein